MSTQSQVNKIVASFLAKQDDLLIELHSLGLDTAELQRPYVIKAVCEALAGGKGWSDEWRGVVALDSKHSQYEFLKTRVRDVMNALKGEKRTASSGKKEADAVEKLLAAFNKMSKAEQKKFLKAVA
jgi:hypothetical protein